MLPELDVAWTLDMAWTIVRPLDAHGDPRCRAFAASHARKRGGAAAVDECQLVCCWPPCPGLDHDIDSDRAHGNDGVWLSYAGQTWISAGRAVPLDNAQFRRVGEYGRFPVYKLSGGSEDMIYVPAREGMVAPYRLKQ